MQEKKNRMIQEARNVHRNIYPCADKVDLNECFTHDNGMLLFWYNTEDQSTHLITAELA